MSLVYLDNAATTAVDPRVAARMAECLHSRLEFGNASSASHDLGDAARELIETARGQVAAAIGAAAAEVTWTSGATEADNLAIFGVANYYRDSGRHLVTARTEHKAVLDPCRELQRRGWQVTYLTPGSNGLIDPAQVAAALRADTVLVSIMHVNNETGVIQDIDAIGAACAQHGTALLHVDAAQSMGKVALNLGASAVDLASLSAHKAYGPKGVGALWVSSRSRGRSAARVQLTPLQYGGGQEEGLRAGTPATHQSIGMGLACEIAAAMLGAELPRIAALREQLWHGLAALGSVYRNGTIEHTVPHILNLSFDGVEGESLLAAVRGSIAVSTGSACTSATTEPSYVLRAMGRNERLSESSLRFGLGRFTVAGDIETAIRVVGAAVTTSARRGGRMRYSQLTQTYFERAPLAGTLQGAGVSRGAAGSRERGTWVQFDLRTAAGAILEARFLAFGCPHTIAAAAWLAERSAGMAAGALPEDALSLGRRFEVPTEKLGRLLIVEDAWSAAALATSQNDPRSERSVHPLR